jgi:hypothetical protein
MERFVPRARGTTPPVLVPYHSELVTFGLATVPGNDTVEGSENTNWPLLDATET